MDVEGPENLVKVVRLIMDGMGVVCPARGIEAIHRINTKYSPQPTIVCFDSRLTVGAIFENKRKLKVIKDWKLDIPGFTDDTRIFVKPSLTPYFRSLHYQARRLKKKGLIQFVMVEDDGRIKIKDNDNEMLILRHHAVLTDKFPNFDFDAP